MKKLFIFVIALFLFSISSCGVISGYEYIEIHVFNEDNNQFTVQTLESLRCSPAGNVCELGKTDGTVTDKTKAGYIEIIYYIGSARSQKKWDQIYEEQMRNFSFTIKDPYGQCETYHMDFVNDKYTKTASGVKYTVTLKKKTS